MTSTMAASKYIDYFEETVTTWIKSLGTISEIMEILGEVQKKWSFLENLFIGSEEVKKELPTESEAFIGIDTEVKEFLIEGATTRYCKEFCNKPGLI